MAKKIKVSEFRTVVRRIIKEEKQKMQKQKLNEGFLRQMIREEMSMMDEMSMMTEDANMQVQFKNMMNQGEGDTFTVNDVFKGQIVPTKGTRVIVDLIAKTDDMVGNPALNKKAEEVLMKYVSFNGRGLSIDPRVEQGVPMIDANQMKAQYAKLKKLQALYDKVKDSNPEQAKRIMNGTPDADGIRGLQEKLKARNLKWVFTGKIQVPENMNVNRV